MEKLLCVDHQAAELHGKTTRFPLTCAALRGAEKPWPNTAQTGPEVPTTPRPTRPEQGSADMRGRVEPAAVQIGAEAQRLWTVVDVSRFLGVPVGTLYQWRTKSGGPPAYRVGRHLRYDPAQVRTWVGEQAA